MMVSYQAAIVRVVSEFYYRDADFDKLSMDDQAIRTLSFVYGVRAERICRDIERVRMVLMDGE